MYTSLQDIKLETVDFKWIQQTTKISHLKKAIRLIEADGDFFKDLKDACYDRIGELDPSQKRIVVDNKMTQQIKQQINKELEEWEQQITKQQSSCKPVNEQEYKIFDQKGGEEQQDVINAEEYFDNEKDTGNQRKKAESQKTKGNEAIKSRDYQEAIKYYTKSISLNPSLYQSYGNRALAYIKLKQFQQALSDCDQALRINPKYTKAYHRKAKALIGIKNKVEAYRSLQDALKMEPDNSQIVTELKDLRQQLSEAQLKELQGSNFKKIMIEEDDEDEDQQIVEK